MKKFFLKKAPLWLLAIAVGSTAVIAGFVQNVGASDEDRPWTTTEYFLIRDLELDTVNDRMVAIGKPDNDVLTITTGIVTVGGVNKPRCGSKCTGSTCDSLQISNDTVYPASNQSYYGSFVIALSTNNSKEGRIPKNIFQKSTGYINPGKKMSDLTLVTDAYNDGICYHTDSGETWTFRKYRVSMD